MIVTAIIAAGGVGKRFGGNKPKQLYPLKNREIISWSIETFIKSNLFHEIIIPVPEDFLDEFNKIIKRFSHFPIYIIKGGITRAESVKKAVMEANKKSERILIHDGARPFITTGELRDFFLFSLDKKAVIFAKKVNETVKYVENNVITKTLNREKIFLAKTPQIFTKELLKDAYEKIDVNFINFTDEASLVEEIGEKVFIFEGGWYNIKITTPEDLLLANFISESIFDRET